MIATRALGTCSLPAAKVPSRDMPATRSPSLTLVVDPTLGRDSPSLYVEDNHDGVI